MKVFLDKNKPLLLETGALLLFVVVVSAFGFNGMLDSVVALSIAFTEIDTFRPVEEFFAVFSNSFGLELQSFFAPCFSYSELIRSFRFYFFQFVQNF